MNFRAQYVQDVWLFTKGILSPILSSQDTVAKKGFSGLFFHEPPLCHTCVPGRSKGARVSAPVEFKVEVISRCYYLKTTG